MASKTATNTTEERISRLGQRRQVVIPREIAESLRMRIGDFVAITQKADTVVIKRKRIVDAEDTLTRAESKKVRRGFKQIKNGRFRLWSDVKHELGR